MLDDNTYPTGLRITDRQMRELLHRHITRHEFHGDWNYDVAPTADDDHEALATLRQTHPPRRRASRRRRIPDWPTPAGPSAGTGP